MLDSDVTSFKSLSKKKLDLSHLCVWSCQCFSIIPFELHTKAGPHCFEAIFVGYEEARIGWIVHDLKGKVHFSHNIIFNEDTSEFLAWLNHLPSCPVHDCILTVAGRDFDEVIQLKELHHLERAKQALSRVPSELRSHAGASTNGGAVADMGTNGGAMVNVSTDGDAVVDMSTNGGAVVDSSVKAFFGHGISPVDLSILSDTFADFLSFLVSSSFPDDIETMSLDTVETDVILHHCFSVISWNPDSIPLLRLSPWSCNWSMHWSKMHKGRGGTQFCFITILYVFHTCSWQFKYWKAPSQMLCTTGRGKLMPCWKGLTLWGGVGAPGGRGAETVGGGGVEAGEGEEEEIGGGGESLWGSTAGGGMSEGKGEVEGFRGWGGWWGYGEGAKWLKQKSKWLNFSRELLTDKEIDKSKV
jgi:hypothetical protein